MSDGDDLVFETRGILGHGSEGRVDMVKTRLSGDTVIARKRWWRHDDKMKARSIKEIHLMSRLKYHHHLIQIVLTYQKGDELGVLMLPIADHDLKTVLESGSTPKHVLRKGLGCLITGLSFLHGEDVLHGDIKPSNILLHNDRFLFTDFGCSKDLLGRDDSVTEATMRGTLGYTAPEIVCYQPRGRLADVFSLGCVLTEILSTLKGYGSGRSDAASFVTLLPYSQNLTAIGEWVEEQKVTLKESVDIVWINTCGKMLRVEPKDRPRPKELLDELTTSSSPSSANDIFCLDCLVQTSNITVDCDNLARNVNGAQSNQQLALGASTIPDHRGPTTRHAHQARCDSRSHTNVQVSLHNTRDFLLGG